MSRQEDAHLREIASKAQEAQIVGEDELGFVFALVKKFRSEIDNKMKQADILRGQIIQLQQNEKMIVDLMDNLIKAADRDKAREEAVARVRGHDIEDEGEETEEVPSE